MSELAPLPSHLALSIARLSFFAVLACDLGQLLLWRAISFSGAPGWVAAGALPLALVAVVFLSVGLFTRYSAIAAYVLTKVVYLYCQTPYHLDNFAETMFFVFVFAPTPRVLALDVRRTGATPAPLAPVPRWFYLLFFMGMEATYADSLTFKFRSVVWRKGLALWMPAALPHFSTGLFFDFLEVGALVRAGSYLALALELLFPLILLRRTRSIVIAIGVLLHLGIAIFFPIPWFGLGVCAAYAFFADWGWLARRFPSAGTASAQPTAFASWPSLRELWPSVGLLLVQVVLDVAPHLGPLSKPATFAARLAGITRHGVYVDAHFSRTAPILRFKMLGAATQPIATFDERGYPQMTGRYWCYINFAMRSAGSQAVRDQAIVRYLTGYFNRLQISDAEIAIEGKDVRTPLKLDFRMDDRIERHPWTPLGHATVKAGQVRVTWDPAASAPHP